MGFRTPILLIIFNRPDTTRQVFEAVRRQKPEVLFVAADGPRDRAGEAEICAEARNVIQIDWECEVRTLYQEKNLGCKLAVSGAITWFFDQVEFGIVLEDDCLPSDSFFKYCEQMLVTFQQDERVMMISGTNYIPGFESYQDYFFSYYGGIWGWASWRRAWEKYDVNILQFKDPNAKQAVADVLLDSDQVDARLKVFGEVHNNLIDTWDYQWSFCRLINSGLSIVPRLNLISNIGFGTLATHTTAASPMANMERFELEFPLRHNPYIVRNKQYDDLFFRRNNPSLLERLRRKLFRILGT